LQRKETLGVGKKTPFLRFESKESQLDSMSVLDPDYSSDEEVVDLLNDQVIIKEVSSLGKGI
jgi:hypothetical protein